MTSLDRAIITRKLQAMVRYLNVLKSYATSDQQAYLDNFGNS
ncbi:hypothetical protein [Leptolyngbya sp. FACHB-261]|nr:hypothetical protein [Leptolyngbya sp. FACHB-261]